jgi:hypothetical protein
MFFILAVVILYAIVTIFILREPETGLNIQGPGDDILHSGGSQGSHLGGKF